MAPQDFAQPPTRGSYRTPFQAFDGDAGGSFVHGDDGDNPQSMSHLTRRSKSVTDADLADLQLNGRRPSFFSRRKQKLTPEQADFSASASAHRSFSGLLPDDFTRELDTKPPTGSKRIESKSFKVKGESGSDTPSSRSKSSKWWSWGSSSKAPKDGRANPVSDSTSAYDSTNRARPANPDLPAQPQQYSAVDGADSSAQLSPLMQSGCMSIFSAATSQPEGPVSEVQWTGVLLPHQLHHSVQFSIRPQREAQLVPRVCWLRIHSILACFGPLYKCMQTAVAEFPALESGITMHFRGCNACFPAWHWNKLLHAIETLYTRC